MTTAERPKHRHTVRQTATAQKTSAHTNSSNDAYIDVNSMNSSKSHVHKSHLSCISWNIEGLAAKLTDIDFVAYITSFDIICLLETFTCPKFDFSVHFKDFKELHSPAEKLSKRGRRSGGTVLLVKKVLADFTEPINSPIDNVRCFKLRKTLFNVDKDILYIGMYNHPGTSNYYRNKDYSCTLEKVEQFIFSFLESGVDLYYIVCGDLNARIGHWHLTDSGMDEDVILYEDDLFIRKSEDSTINGFGKNLMDFCSTFHFSPLNGMCSGDEFGRFTFSSDRGNSVVDYFLCSLELLSLDMHFNVVNRIESKHMPVTLNVKCFVNNVDVQKTAKQNSEKLKWDPGKKHMFMDFLCSTQSQTILTDALSDVETDIDLALDKFTNMLLSAGKCMKHTVRFAQHRPYTNRWFDKDCLLKKREAGRALNKWKRSGNLTDAAEYKQKRSDYQAFTRQKQKEYRSQVLNTLMENKNDSSKFWSTVRKAKSKPFHLPKIDINDWQNHFEKILGSSGDHPSRGASSDCSRSPEEEVVIPELDDEMTEDEVRQAIRRLKPGKSPGLDQVLGEFLKAAEIQIVPFLTKLFNRIYDSGQYPESWTKSVIVPLLKKGDASNPENYRGISLLSIISKLFTYILNQRLYNWAEAEGKISAEQAGFRKDYSTVDHIFTLMSMIKKCLYGHKRSKFYVAFVDYQKAFDTVDRDKLCTVLERLQTSTKMINIIKGMYNSVKSCVRWGSDLSEYFDCPSGVKQGCLMSPLIFSLLITEVANAVNLNGKHGFQFLPGLRELFLLLFADDIVLFSLTPGGLQNQLDNLSRASDGLGLTVNLEKTKIMVFRKGGYLSRREKWFLKGRNIEVVNSYKYLGFTFTTKMSFEVGLEDCCRRAKSKVAEIFKTMWALGRFEMGIFFKLFDAQVKPMLLYAAEVWGMCEFEMIESVHMFACKRLLNVSNKTPNTMIYGETGRHPLYADSMARSLNYWFRLQKVANSRFPGQAYRMILKNVPHGNEENVSVHNWALSVQRCLDKYGFTEVWLNGGVGDEKQFLKMFKQRVSDCFRQDWHAKLEASDRFAFYRSFKSMLEPERYINSITIAKFRHELTRLRLGLCELNINNRYSDKSEKCPSCDESETEKHFIFVCPMYTNLRQKYILRHCGNVRDRNVVYFMQSENALCLRDISMYCFYAFKQREHFLRQESVQT